MADSRKPLGVRFEEQQEKKSGTRLFGKSHQVPPSGPISINGPRTLVSNFSYHPRLSTGDHICTSTGCLTCYSSASTAGFTTLPPASSAPIIPVTPTPPTSSPTASPTPKVAPVSNPPVSALSFHHLNRHRALPPLLLHNHQHCLHHLLLCHPAATACFATTSIPVTSPSATCPSSCKVPPAPAPAPPCTTPITTATSASSAISCTSTHQTQEKAQAQAQKASRTCTSTHSTQPPSSTYGFRHRGYIPSTFTKLRSEWRICLPSTRKAVDVGKDWIFHGHSAGGQRLRLLEQFASTGHVYT
ncbi:uncharacterized protein PB18E9.04c [Eucalyptus grandis]|uniref:uncharacterized protein PB18E9.04c n=1 Tax=Eucalyptus grandis TaxID=71139 RepID=UPI00192E8C3F|nr:uncharacterized protein PB18E9.04c [Eucalyptus grandis]